MAVGFSGVTTSKRKRAWASTVKSSLDTVGPTVNVGQVTEVDKDTFWPIVKAAGDKTVVLDMYTQWYAPFLSVFTSLLSVWFAGNSMN